MDKTEAVTLILTTTIPAVCTLAGVIISNHSANKKIAAQVKSLEEHQNKNYLGILRLTIMSEEMPVSAVVTAPVP